MAINKVVNSGKLSHGGMRNTLEYVTKAEKLKDGLFEINGPYNGVDLSYDQLYRDWLSEKKAWGKDSGRMYAHNIISFHKDEKVSPEQVLEIAREFSDHFFRGYQYVITVHQDRDHLHAHIVTNTVSFLDGMKLHQSRSDLQRQKDYTNDLCKERGLSIAEKGKHFDGSRMEQGETIAWSKDKYNLLLRNTKKSYIADLALALMEVTPQSFSKEDFISAMAEKGWTVRWEDTRKHIVYRNKNGDKVRDTNIEKTFTDLPATKEALTNEFKRNANTRRNNGCEEYYSEVESVISGADAALKGEGTDRSVGKQQTASTRREGRKRGISSGAGDGEEQEFNSFLTEFRANESAGGKSVEASLRSAEASKRASDSLEAERRSEEQRRAEYEKRDREHTEERQRIRGHHR